MMVILLAKGQVISILGCLDDKISGVAVYYYFSARMATDYTSMNEHSIVAIWL